MSRDEKKYLLKKIEEKRNELLRLASEGSYTCEKILEVSKHLDELLNCYQQGSCKLITND